MLGLLSGAGKVNGKGVETLPVNVVHPRAFVSTSAVMGLGVFVGPGAVGARVRGGGASRDH